MYDKYFSSRIKHCSLNIFDDYVQSHINAQTVSFVGGSVNVFKDFKENIKIAAEKILKDNNSDIFQYSTPFGLSRLREYIAERYKKTFGLNNIDEENVLITTGSTQGLDLIGKVFVNKNDKILIENPSFINTTDVLKMHEADCIPVSLNTEGLDSAEFKFTVDKFKPKLAYLIPNIQNPLGITYTAANRQKISEIIKNNEIILIQDNTYGELSFENKIIPFVGQNERESNIYLGTFSKVIAGGFRLGYIISDKKIISRLAVAKQASDIHSDNLCQRIIFEYFRNNDFDKHVEKIRNSYKKQSEIMVFAIQKYLADKVEYSTPQGGMYVWVKLKNGLSGYDLLRKTIEKNVVFMPGEFFCSSDKAFDCIRLGYTGLLPEKIMTGIKTIATCIEES